MSAPVYDLNTHPKAMPNPTIAHADKGRAGVGVCFSGGGSRAPTCAWGQMMGLRQLRDTGGKPLLDRIRYISSVSGGSCASVLYTFLPEKIADEQFFVPCFSPQDLYLETSPEGGMDVSLMGADALVSVPQRFANLCDPDPFRNIIAGFLTIVLLRDLIAFVKTSVKLEMHNGVINTAAQASPLFGIAYGQRLERLCPLRGGRRESVYRIRRSEGLPAGLR
ncbi:MAG: patatin-like phospholipase family protein [Pseudomonadota bacterium]|nr:patatin-like phospholipase family protein [Pseudomonadota bacterium]